MDTNEQQTIVVKQKTPLVDGKTVVLGGGIVALILFFFFRGGGGKGSTSVKDARPLLFKLRSAGLYLGDKQMSIPDAIARVLAGGRKDALLQVAGDVRHGDVDTLDIAFQSAGISLRSYDPSQAVSLYSRGMNGGRYA